MVLSRHGSLVTPNGRKEAAWLCTCDCGREVVVRSRDLVSDRQRSCGCLRRELIRQRNTIHGCARRGAQTREYLSWLGARGRCYQKKDSEYRNYGARGIRVCDRWRDNFAAFLEDMGPRPAGRSLDRIDVNGNYEPTNCRWATAAEQMNNRRSSRYVEVDGEKLTVAQASRRLGVPAHKIYDRLSKGLSVEGVRALM